MVKEAIIMVRQVEVTNLETGEYCMLNILSGDKSFYKTEKQIPYFTGLYFRDKDTFFALYPTEDGPIMYYGGNEYPLNKKLHIKLRKMGDWREFCIEDYDIHIKYRTSKYIGFDVWSEEEDVDLFYQIEKYYKSDEYYKKFTK